MNSTLRLYLLAVAFLIAFAAGILIDQLIYVHRYRELVEKYHCDCIAYESYINRIAPQP